MFPVSGSGDGQCCYFQTRRRWKNSKHQAPITKQFSDFQMKQCSKRRTNNTRLEKTSKRLLAILSFGHPIIMICLEFGASSVKNSKRRGNVQAISQDYYSICSEIMSLNYMKTIDIGKTVSSFKEPGGLLTTGRDSVGRPNHLDVTCSRYTSELMA